MGGAGQGEPGSFAGRSRGQMPTLILTPRFTPDAQALWQAAVRKGWAIERLERWEVPDRLRGVEEPVLYLEGLFGPTLAAAFGRTLFEPPVDWLARLPAEHRKRRVELLAAREARGLRGPAFIKPPNDKSFPARVYREGEFPAFVEDSAPVLVSEVVEWESEFRCFLLDRELRALSVYLRNGELQRHRDFRHAGSEEAALRAFVATILRDARVDLPRAAALDVGLIRGRGWAVVELNSAWAAGIYGCDPEEVLEVLRHASGSLP